MTLTFSLYSHTAYRLYQSAENQGVVQFIYSYVIDSVLLNLVVPD